MKTSTTTQHVTQDGPKSRQGAAYDRSRLEDIERSLRFAVAPNRSGGKTLMVFDASGVDLDERLVAELVQALRAPATMGLIVGRLQKKMALGAKKRRADEN